MKIGRYEFGWATPLKWKKFWKTDAENPCGCTIWEFGYWYFTILRYACAGEPDPRPEVQSPVEIAMRGIAAQLEQEMYVSKSEMKRQNVLKGRPMMENVYAVEPSQLKKLPAKKIKKAKKALKNLKVKRKK